VAAITVLKGVLELVERHIFGVQKGPIAGQEVVVDHLGK
jgi:hypothetical protein